MTTFRNRTFVRRREMRLMAEEQVRAFNAHQRLLAQQAHAAAASTADQMLAAMAEEVRSQLAGLQVH